MIAIERARRGLTVTVLSRPRHSAMKALMTLREAGAVVLGFPYLHAKALSSDAGEALVMSANLEPHGLDEGFEVGVEIEARRDLNLGRVAPRSPARLDATPPLPAFASSKRAHRTFARWTIELPAIAARP